MCFLLPRYERFSHLLFSFDSLLDNGWLTIGAHSLCKLPLGSRKNSHWCVYLGQSVSWWLWKFLFLLVWWVGCTVRGPYGKESPPQRKRERYATVQREGWVSGGGRECLTWMGQDGMCASYHPPSIIRLGYFRISIALHGPFLPQPRPISHQVGGKDSPNYSSHRDISRVPSSKIPPQIYFVFLFSLQLTSK